MIIGYVNNYYPDVRCIINKVHKANEEIQYKKITDYNKYINKILKRLKIARKNDNDFFFQSKNKKYDILHTFNYVCKIKRPWVVTFETTLPRIQETLKFHHEEQIINKTKNLYKGLSMLHDSNCKKIIALSNCAYNIQKDLLKQVDDNSKEIINKMEVIHPPQKVLITEEELLNKYKNYSKKIEFVFVGNDFFRKGGDVIVDILTEYIKKGYNIHLNIVSKMGYGDYATFSTLEDSIKYKKIIEESDFISLYQNIPNSEVLKIIKKSHIGLLPTFADTYGYSVLEMQATGVPVVTTNIRALSEINNERCGWICKLETNKYNEALYSKEESRIEMKERLKTEFNKIIEEILNSNVDIYQEKGIQSLNRIKKEHNEEEYSKKLFKIYSECIT